MRGMRRACFGDKLARRVGMLLGWAVLTIVYMHACLVLQEARRALMINELFSLIA
jgi:hypothetical protein